MNMRLICTSVIIGCCLILSGCVFKDTAMEIITEDEVKILGNWYDKEAKYYFSFTDEGKYTVGFDRLLPNTIGEFEVKDEKLYLTITHAMVDGKTIVVPENERVTTEMAYRFNLSDDLVLSGQHNAFTLRRVDVDALAEDAVLPTDKTIIGLYQEVGNDRFYYFDKNGGVSLSSGSDDKTYEGTYAITNNKIRITFVDLETETSYFFSLTDDNQLALTSESGDLSYYKKIN